MPRRKNCFRFFSLSFIILQHTKNYTNDEKFLAQFKLIFFEWDKIENFMTHKKLEGFRSLSMAGD